MCIFFLKSNIGIFLKFCDTILYNIMILLWVAVIMLNSERSYFTMKRVS